MEGDRIGAASWTEEAVDNRGFLAKGVAFLGGRPGPLFRSTTGSVACAISAVH